MAIQRNRRLSRIEKDTAPIDIFVDPVFFHKSQIKFGTKLCYFGRLAPNSEWEVIKIVTFYKRKGIIRRRSIDHIEHLADDITLLRHGTNDIREITFAYASYSAIWRLV